MEDFSTFWQILIVILIGLLFFKEEIMPFIRRWLGMKEVPDASPATTHQIDELTEYVNHQQTELIKRQTALMESTLDIVRDIRRKHDEWDKYGINARCEVIDK